MSTLHVWLVVGMVGIAAGAGGCSDDSGTAQDQGQGNELGTLEASAGIESGTGKEAGPAAEAGPDGAAVKEGGASDHRFGDGACLKASQHCGSGLPPCCAGLQCCSGMPVPPGQEHCGVTCPISDRNLKYDVNRRPLTPSEALAGVVRLPISTWTYNNEPPGVRHVGPMAQDFHATFGVGASERFIAPVDAEGVALAAIQALHGELSQLRCEVQGLRRENARLRAEVRRMRPR